MRIATALLLSMVVAPAAAQDMWLSPEGTDSSNCQLDAPCRTIQYAIDNNGTPGSTIRLLPGVYTEHISFNTQSFTIAGNPHLTTERWGDGAVVIDGTSGSSTPVVTVSLGSVVILRDLEIINGTTDQGGAAIANAGDLTLKAVAVRENTSVGAEGGGLLNLAGATAQVLDSTFASNSASSGGAISNHGDLTISRSTFSGNSTDLTGVGGAIYNDGMATIENSTIAFNSAAIAGGIGSSATATTSFRHSVFGSNAAPTSADCNGPLTSLGFGLVQDPTGCDLTGDLSTVLTSLDPILAPLAANGGPTETHAPMATSRLLK